MSRAFHPPSGDVYGYLRFHFITGRIMGFSTIPITRGGSLKDVPFYLVAYSAFTFLVTSSYNIFATIQSLVSPGRANVPDSLVLMTAAGDAVPLSVSALMLWNLYFIYLFQRRRIHWMFSEVSALASKRRCDFSPIRATLKRQLILLVLVPVVQLSTYFSLAEDVPHNRTAVAAVLISWILTNSQQYQMYNILALIHLLLIDVNHEMDSLVNLYMGSRKKFAPLEGIHLKNKIRELQTAHFRIRGLSAGWNCLYGVQCLFIVMSTFFNVICASYLTAEIVLSLWIVENPSSVALGGSVWVTASVAQLVCIIFACEEVAAAMEKTSKIILQALLMTNDKELQEKLEEFSLQIVHTRVTFTSYGIFKLEMSLLTSMVAAVINNIVVIIQFQLASLPS